VVWLLNLYVIMSVVISLSAAFHVGIAAGVYAVLTITLALITGHTDLVEKRTIVVPDCRPAAWRRAAEN
jgi:hypothetical protein